MEDNARKVRTAAEHGARNHVENGPPAGGPNSTSVARRVARVAVPSWELLDVPRP